MLKLTWGFLNKPEVTSGLRKLYNAQGLQGIVAYRAGRICERAQKEMGLAQKEAHKLLEKCATKDDKGGILGYPNGPFAFPSKEVEEQHDLEFKTLMDTTFEEKVHKLPLHSLDPVKLTPGEMVALTDIIDGIPEEG